MKRPACSQVLQSFPSACRLGEFPELSASSFLSIFTPHQSLAAIAMAATPDASSSSTSGSAGEAPPPSSSWQKCTLQESDIQDMVECGILPEKQISRWRCCYGKEFPWEDTDQTVTFKSFYEKSFALPVGIFTSTGSR